VQPSGASASVQRLLLSALSITHRILIVLFLFFLLSLSLVSSIVDGAADSQQDLFEFMYCVVCFMFLVYYFNNGYGPRSCYAEERCSNRVCIVEINLNLQWACSCEAGRKFRTFALLTFLTQAELWLQTISYLLSIS